MINLFRQNVWRFEPGEFSESTEELVNPARGWYEIFPFRAEQTPDFTETGSSMRPEDSLVLIIVDIGFYREREIDGPGILHIREILRFFAECGKDIILRIVYDREGNGLKQEPESFSLVKTHFEQIAGLTALFSDNILVYQGMLLGSWGEMHTSRFLSRDHLRELYSIFESRTNGRPFLAVRRPMYWRQLQTRQIYSKPSFRIQAGLFDDGILGSHTDLGTFGVRAKENAGWWDAWETGDELDFEDVLCRYVPNGGEVVLEDGQEQTDSDQLLQAAKERLSKMHITYLNRMHDRRLLNIWRICTWKENGPWDGMNGFDYIGRHLGYRFCIRDAEISRLRKEQYQLVLSIENVGFANLYQEAEVYLVWKEPDGRETRELTDWDARNWVSGAVIRQSHVISPKEGKLYLSLNRKQDGKLIRTANTMECNGRLLLGEFYRKR